MGIETLALAGLAAGTGLQVGGTLQQGRQTEKIAEARAQIDLKNAEAVRRAAVEEATIEKERGIRSRAAARAAAAAGGIRLNEGLPLVIDTQIAAATAKDIGFILERGRVEEGAFRSRAALEIAQGKALRRKSKFAALTLGLTGAANIAFMGVDAGLFTKTQTLPSGLPRVGRFKPEVGATLARF